MTHSAGYTPNEPRDHAFGLPMTVKFCGQQETFADIIWSISRYVHWQEVTETSVRVALDAGVVVTYHWKTMTIMFQGPSPAARAMKTKFLQKAGRLATET